MDGWVVVVEMVGPGTFGAALGSEDVDFTEVVAVVFVLVALSPAVLEIVVVGVIVVGVVVVEPAVSEAAPGLE